MLILVENSHRLADELRAEQEMAMLIERDRKLLEAQVLLNFTGLALTYPFPMQVKEAQTRLDEAEQNALRGGKKAVAKMETRIRELESELDAENRRFKSYNHTFTSSHRRPLQVL